MANIIPDHLLAEEVRTRFGQVFGGSSLLVQSPGRVNIIGEHTDYNNGFVLPAAIDKGIYLALREREDNIIKLHAQEFNAFYEGPADNLRPVAESRWANYVIGVAAMLHERGYTTGGFNAVLHGNIPIGAGMSSSAAVECAVVFALNEQYGLHIPLLEMVQIAQQAEHRFAGVKCGIMDQFASMYGKKDQLVRLDCKSLAYEYIPLNLEGVRLVLFNTNVKHSLASSAYNKRREECMEGVSMVQQRYPEVESLRDVTLPMLEEIVRPHNELVFRRCAYVVAENQRLLDACEALKSGDIRTLGSKMYESHGGLSKHYEVSCPELDFLVDHVRDNPAVLGARMMGGGFGGCTINLVREDAIESLVDSISIAYHSKMGKTLSVYIAKIADGTSVVR